MTDLKILLADDRRQFRPGDTLEGVAGWRLPAAPHSVELRLFWFTRGKGTEDVGLVNRFVFEAAKAEEGRRFHFVLPDEPYSFSGQLISLVWALELLIQPGNHAARTEFFLSPTGEEIVLHAHARTR